jgi:hypothetical protein
MSDDVYACSICGAARYGGHANDAQPLKDGRCCDACYANYVMPARLEELRAAEHERDAGENSGREWYAGRPKQWRLH